MVATAKSVNIGTLISRSPDVWHGLPMIAGTRIGVIGIVSLHLIDHMKPEEIAQSKGVTLAQVFAALAYYYANKQLVDKEIAQEQASYDRLAKENQNVTSDS